MGNNKSNKEVKHYGDDPNYQRGNFFMFPYEFLTGNPKNEEGKLKAGNGDNDLANLSGNAVKIYLLFMAKRNYDLYKKEVWCAYDYITEYTGIKSQTTIDNAILELIEAGWIEDKRRSGFSEHNQYFMNSKKEINNDVIDRVHYQKSINSKRMKKILAEKRVKEASLGTKVGCHSIEKLDIIHPNNGRMYIQKMDERHPINIPNDIQNMEAYNTNPNNTNPNNINLNNTNQIKLKSIIVNSGSAKTAEPIDPLDSFKKPDSVDSSSWGKPEPKESYIENKDSEPKKDEVKVNDVIPERYKYNQVANNDPLPDDLDLDLEDNSSVDNSDNKADEIIKQINEKKSQMNITEYMKRLHKNGIKPDIDIYRTENNNTLLEILESLN
jgi:hypothetical protein